MLIGSGRQTKTAVSFRYCKIAEGFRHLSFSRFQGHFLLFFFSDYFKRKQTNIFSLKNLAKSSLESTGDKLMQISQEQIVRPSPQKLTQI
jgi:hypothetical protein